MVGGEVGPEEGVQATAAPAGRKGAVRHLTVGEKAQSRLDEVTVAVLGAERVDRGGGHARLGGSARSVGGESAVSAADRDQCVQGTLNRVAVGDRVQLVQELDCDGGAVRVGELSVVGVRPAAVRVLNMHKVPGDAVHHLTRCAGTAQSQTHDDGAPRVGVRDEGQAAVLPLMPEGSTQAGIDDALHTGDVHQGMQD